MSVALIIPPIPKQDWANHILDTIELCARVSYQSAPAENIQDRNKFLRKLLRAGHWSVFEHGSFTVIFRDVSRGMTHQLVRHRHTAITQESTRYVGRSNGFKIKVPPNTVSNHMLDMAQTQLTAAYKTALIHGKDVARQFLPIGATTSIAVTANLREWHTIFSRRTDLKAHWEIREEMISLLEEVQPLFYPVFDDFQVIDDGKVYAVPTGDYQPS